MRILAIAINTFREARRSRMFYVILAFAFVVILTSRAIAWISSGADLKVIMDMGLAAIIFFNVIMAIFLGTSLVINEMERQTLYTILSKPIHRWEYITGKFTGLCMAMFVSVLVMSLFLVGYYKLMAFQLELEASSLHAISTACFFIFVEICLLIAVAILISLLSSPILSAVFSFCVFIIGHGVRALTELIAWLDKLPGVPFKEGIKKICRFLYYFLPNLDNFDYKAEATHNIWIGWNRFFLSLGYGILYSCILLLIAVFIFQRKRL